MDVAATVTSMMQANGKSDLGTAVMKMALKSDQAAVDLVSQAAQSAASAPPPAGMGNLLDMTV